MFERSGFNYNTKNAPAARVEKALELQLSIAEEHTTCLKGLYMVEQWEKYCELRIQQGRCRQIKTTQKKQLQAYRGYYSRRQNSTTALTANYKQK
jgi:uncharacterized membrane protein